MTRRESTAVVVDLGSELANLQAVLTRLAGPKVSAEGRQPRRRR